MTVSDPAGTATLSGIHLFLLLCLLCLGLSACASTQVQVRGQHDVAIGGVIRR